MDSIAKEAPIQLHGSNSLKMRNLQKKKKRKKKESKAQTC